MATTIATPASKSEPLPLPTEPASIPSPIVLDLGKQRRKRIKQLRRGAGKLMDEVNASIVELRVAGAIGPTAQPVVVVVREKRRKTRGLLSPLI
jgi:hypothetical protein